jgi:hypothetical protein
MPKDEVTEGYTRLKYEKFHNSRMFHIREFQESVILRSRDRAS